MTVLPKFTRRVCVPGKLCSIFRHCIFLICRNSNSYFPVLSWRREREGCGTPNVICVYLKILPPASPLSEWNLFFHSLINLCHEKTKQNKIEKPFLGPIPLHFLGHFLVPFFAETLLKTIVCSPHLQFLPSYALFNSSQVLMPSHHGNCNPVSSC